MKEVCVMDETKFFEEAKKLAMCHLQEDLRMVEEAHSIDDLTVILFGASYSNLFGFHICKRHVINKACVSEKCKNIQDQYFKAKSSD